MTRIFSAGGHLLVVLDMAEVIENDLERVKKELKAAVKAGKPRKAKKLKEMLERMYNRLDEL